jgi:hypothetical protein
MPPRRLTTALFKAIPRILASLFIIQLTFGFDAFSFAFGAFFTPFFLFLIGPGVCRPVSFKAVSPVIWPECHRTLS